MAYALIGKQITHTVLDELAAINNHSTYAFHEPKPNSIVLNVGTDEMIRIAQDGFYVRGVKVPVDDKEAETVYLAFKQWLAWANLQRK